MKRACLWMGLVAVVAAGCWEEESGVYTISVERDQLSWPAAGISGLEVFTPSGKLELHLGGGEEVIYAAVDRQCKSVDRDDAEAHVGDISIEGSLAGDMFSIAAVMPETEEREYFADMRVGAPLVERLEAYTGDGDIEIGGAPGNVEAGTPWGTIRCNLRELPAGRVIVLKGRRTDIIMTAPPDVSAVFDIRTDYGMLEIGGFESLRYTDEKEYRKAGYIGDGRATILITTVMGSVKIEGQEEIDRDF